MPAIAPALRDEEPESGAGEDSTRGDCEDAVDVAEAFGVELDEMEVTVAKGVADEDIEDGATYTASQCPISQPPHIISSP